MNTFQPPTMAELHLEGQKIGLPSVEVEKFFFYYDSKNWMVGKNKMQRWRSALSGWACRWRACNQHQPGLSNMDKLLRLKELERIEVKMKAISGSYSENMSWEATDKLRYKELKARQAEILRMLGMSV